MEGKMNAIKMKKIICFLFGHKWIYLEALYVGEFQGKMCERCDKREGYYVN